MYIPKHLRFTRLKGKGRALFANKNLRKGSLVVKFGFDSVKSCRDASPESVQIGENKFLDSTHYYASDYINHSCNPSTKIDFAEMCFVAVRDIKKGQEITYNYLTTEYDMAKDNLDFECMCNSKSCVGRINGFRYLSKSQRLKIKNQLSPFLMKKL
ncbi:SET domain-containing protein [Candidatus Woesearchaeota archaeon]|nr:SET domain-containing protein [Candidatus Woesearchaeota archaeon]